MANIIVGTLSCLVATHILTTPVHLNTRNGNNQHVLVARDVSRRRCGYPPRLRLLTADLNIFNQTKEFEISVLRKIKSTELNRIIGANSKTREIKY